MPPEPPTTEEGRRLVLTWLVQPRRRRRTWVPMRDLLDHLRSRKWNRQHIRSTVVQLMKRGWVQKTGRRPQVLIRATHQGQRVVDHGEALVKLQPNPSRQDVPPRRNHWLPDPLLPLTACGNPVHTVVREGGQVWTSTDPTDCLDCLDDLDQRCA